MRVIAIIVAILGLATFVYGILFVAQAGTAEDEIALSISPLALNEVNAKYDAVATKYNQMKTAEEPKIQAGQAMPSDMYNYLSAQRALLGLAKSNIGTAKFLRSNGTVDIILGLGVVLAGLALLRKAQSAAA
jgi:hypothetical protein